jgi:uncharacterized protein (UPF0335 family)
MTSLTGSSRDQLRQYISQIERLDEERRATVADIRDKYAEAKAVGFDPKALRKLIALRRKSKVERDEEDAILDTYMAALGMIGEMEAAE